MKEKERDIQTGRAEEKERDRTGRGEEKKVTNR